MSSLTICCKHTFARDGGHRAEPSRMSKTRGLSSTVLDRLETRLRRHISKRWPDILDLRIRARGEFVYVDVRPDAESPEFEPVCRLGYVGSPDVWEFAYFSWSRGARGGYEISVLNSGSPFGPAEECFDCAYQPAGTY